MALTHYRIRTNGNFDTLVAEDLMGAHGRDTGAGSNYLGRQPRLQAMCCGELAKGRARLIRHDEHS